MSRYLMHIVIFLMVFTGISAATSEVRAQAESETCHQVDLDNLKVFEDSNSDWVVEDISNSWSLHFRTTAIANRFVEILRAHSVRVYCERFGYRNRTLMEYILTAELKAPTGKASGEKCTEFDAATLKVEWSDEAHQFILTDGKTAVISDWPTTKEDLADVLSIIKKYNFTTRCRENYGPSHNDIQYWKGTRTVFTPFESARGRARNAGGLTDLKALPPTYPLVCRGAADAMLRATDAASSTNPEDAAQGNQPEQTFTLKFRKAAVPAPSGLAEGECSWIDRALNAAEPDQLVQRVREGAEHDPEYKWFTELRDPEVYWTFDVYNDGRGRMIATKARPSTALKPKPEGMSEWTSMGGPVGSAPAGPAAVRGKDRSVLIFIKGKDGALWTRTSKDGKWISEWLSLGGEITSAPAAASWDLAETVVVVARRSDNAIWSKRLYKGTWGDWISLGGSSNYGPAISARGVDRYEVFAVGTDGAMSQQSFNGSAPSAWRLIGKANDSRGEETIDFTFAPVAVSNSSKIVDVFAVGSDQQLHWNTWSESSGIFVFQWARLGSVLTSAPGATMSSDGEPIVVVRGTDYGVEKIMPRMGMRKSEIFNWVSLGGKLFSQPAVVADATGYIQVFVIGADGGLWWRRFPERE